MRVMYEAWFVKYKVDVVFAGHVHAYERSVSSLLNLFIFSCNLIRGHGGIYSPRQPQKHGPHGFGSKLDRQGCCCCCC